MCILLVESKTKPIREVQRLLRIHKPGEFESLSKATLGFNILVVAEKKSHIQFHITVFFYTRAGQPRNGACARRL
jgi:hypothetical protein